jgi:tetratricopeptide (TPR) repeat protein
MGRSLFKPAPANTIEDYAKRHEFWHSASDTHYAMIVRGTDYYQRRWQIGFDGTETNVEELKIDYVIGSGNHARAYLHRTVRGGFIELPLGWYSQPLTAGQAAVPCIGNCKTGPAGGVLPAVSAEKSGYWSMSPGFDNPHPATRRFASYGCIFCHDAYPKIPAGHDAPGSDPVFAGDLPEGIDCQRCHGDGTKHMRIAQSASATPAEIRASILNPSRLTPALQMDVCMQCHLEPTSGDLPSLIRRFDRAPFSFTPGEPLANFELVFDHAPGAGHDDKFEIVNSSAYRLRKSLCFVKSKGAMTCTTCHDPHTAAANYSDACRKCHASMSAGHPTAATECISCHMPKRQTDDVVNVVMTDHWIQRRPAPRELTKTQPYRGEVVAYYPSPPLYLAVAQVALQNNTVEGAAELSRQLARLQPRESEFYMVLGQARNSIDDFEHALRFKPDSPRILIALAGALKAGGQFSRAAENLQRAIQISPDNSAAWYQSGALDFSMGHISEAIDKMRKAVALDPDFAGGCTGLAEILWRAGNIDDAEDDLREALRMNPYDPGAYDLIGRVLAGKGHAAESLFDFEKATRLRPEYAPYLYDYALELSSANRIDDAQTRVQAALRADPDMAEGHELLGGLLAAKRQLPEAEREYAEALRLKPDFARARLDLARVLAAEGNLSGAIEQLQKAAEGSDPQVAQLASQALRRLGQ